MPGIWKPLTNQPTFNPSTMMLLTDGRVMVQEEGTANWFALTPDSTGSYIHGSWSNLAPMSTWRRYYASGILMDGTMFLCGGEQSGGGGDYNHGEIYNPVTDSWSPIATPPWSTVGDASSCVLPNGHVMIGNISSGACLIYDPTSNNWSSTGSQPGNTNEETWILLPDETILTVQCFPPYGGQKYIISSGTWHAEGTPPDTLVNPAMSEIGPAMLMYNGKVLCLGAMNSGGNGKTALYTLPATPGGVGTWAAGPNIPHVGGNPMVCNDCPATLMPNGKVLFTASQYISNYWGSPTYFFEYDPVSNTIAQAPTPANANNIIYMSRMMLLPSGEVMYINDSAAAEIYQPGGSPSNAWRPTITSVTAFFNVGTIVGTQLNGLSQANVYGDDCSPFTNYPLVQLRNTSTGDIHYCRTYDFSTMGVATGATPESCKFNFSGVPSGTYELRVIANGIASLAHTFSVSIRKPYVLDIPVKEEFDTIGKIVAEGDPFNWINEVINPEITQLENKLSSLTNSVERLTSIIQAAKLPQVGVDTSKKARVEEKGAGKK